MTDKQHLECRFPRSEIFSTRVSVSSFEQAVQFVRELADSRCGGYVSAANVYSVTEAMDSRRLEDAVNSSTYTSADGMPLVWLMKARGLPAERVHNDDLFFECCRRNSHWRHYLVGGREQQEVEVALALKKKYPEIDIVGFAPTPIRPVPADQTLKIIDSINAARPDIVWVGMGTVHQDLWMNEVSKHIQCPQVGVGSAFDLLSGRTRPAPQWIKNSGLQWLFRLVQEPKRLARRYVRNNSRFLFELLRQRFR